MCAAYGSGCFRLLLNHNSTVGSTSPLARGAASAILDHERFDLR